MITYCLTNLILSLLSLLALRGLRDGPPRVNFRLALSTMLLWLIPWPLLSLPMPLSVASSIVYQSEFWSAAQAAVDPMTMAPSGGSWDPLIVVMIAGFTGMLVFLLQAGQLANRLNRLGVQAVNRSDLWTRIGEPADTAKIFVSAELDNAFVAGFVTPTVWMGPRQAASPRLDTILRHELEHLRAQDNRLQHLVSLLRAVFWWNPLVWMLARQAERHLELACDHRCAQRQRDYRYALADELLANHRHATVRLTATLEWQSRFNMERLKRLEEDYRMTPRHTLVLVLLLLSGFAVAAVNTVAESGGGESAIQLTVTTTEPGADGGENTTTHTVEFVGDDIAEKLVRLADEQGVEHQIDRSEAALTKIELISTDIWATRAVLEAFDGTPMEAVFNPAPLPDTGEPILVDLVLEHNETETARVTLAQSSGTWSGILAGDHVLRIRSTTSAAIGPEQIEFAVMIMNLDGEILARPVLISRLGETATIKSGQKGGDTFLLTLTAHAS